MSNSSKAGTIGCVIVLALTLVAQGCGVGGDGGSGTTPPTGVTYAVNPAVYTIGVAITPNVPTASGGAVTSWSVTPALPAGLALDPATGYLSGTPTAFAVAADYVVTAANADGSATVTLRIGVSDGAPAGLAAVAGVQQVQLTWTALPGALSYNVYTSDTSPVTTGGAVLQDVVSTSALLEPVPAGTHYYAVSAVTLAGETPLSTEATAGVNRLAFVTSVGGVADLGGWADAGGATGIAAADAICQARAAAANRVGTFRAWLATSTDDAYCRVQGLTGTKADRCGQATLPAAGGPWIRTDGTVFAEELATLTTDGALLTPAKVNEFGVAALPYTGGDRYFTNTGYDGVLAGGTCSDWTSSANTPAGFGEGTQPYSAWSNGSGGGCTNEMRLLCFEMGAGPALRFEQAGKRAFVTSALGTGDLSSWADAGGESGVAAADAICQARATAGSLPGTFRAWISDGTSAPTTRITSDGPWIRVDGVPLASSRADLFDGMLTTALVVDEHGSLLTSGAWTGTTSTGGAEANHCAAWTDATSAVTGRTGYVNLVGSPWASFTDRPCSAYNSLYCFED